MVKPVERVLSWYFSRNALPYWGILMLDFAILLMSGLMTCWLFVFRNTEDVDVLILLRTLVMYAVPGFVGARMFHTYSGIVRYSSFVDLTRVFYANFISLIIAHLMHYLVLYYPGGVFYHLGFRHIIMMYAVATLLMWGLRVGVKTLFEITTLDARAIRVLIYGAMEGGVGLAKLIRSQKPARFNVKGFIAHNGNYNTHNRVMGLHVFNATDDIAQIIKRMHIEAVLIATPRVGEFRNDQKLQDQILGAGVKIFMSESAKELSVKDGELKAENGERMAADSKKKNKDLAEEYKSQSLPSVARVNYKGPTDRADSWESQAHTGGPMCYGCCGPKCTLSLVAIVAVLIVCCAYVSQDKTCCSICYWPF